MRRHCAEKKKALIRSTVAVPQVLEQGLNPDHPSEKVFAGATGHGRALQQDEAGGLLAQGLVCCCCVCLTGGHDIREGHGPG